MSIAGAHTLRGRWSVRSERKRWNRWRKWPGIDHVITLCLPTFPSTLPPKRSTRHPPAHGERQWSPAPARALIAAAPRVATRPLWEPHRQPRGAQQTGHWSVVQKKKKMGKKGSSKSRSTATASASVPSSQQSAATSSQQPQPVTTESIEVDDP